MQQRRRRTAHRLRSIELGRGWLLYRGAMLLLLGELERVRHARGFSAQVLRIEGVGLDERGACAVDLYAELRKLPNLLAKARPGHLTCLLRPSLDMALACVTSASTRRYTL